MQKNGRACRFTRSCQSNQNTCASLHKAAIHATDGTVGSMFQARTICVVCRRCESNAQYGMKFKKYKPIVWRAHSQRKMTENLMKIEELHYDFFVVCLLSLFCLLCALTINFVHIVEIAWLAHDSVKNFKRFADINQAIAWGNAHSLYFINVSTGFPKQTTDFSAICMLCHNLSHFIWDGRL